MSEVRSPFGRKPAVACLLKFGEYFFGESHFGELKRQQVLLGKDQSLVLNPPKKEPN
jgi:hypothetical protein